MHITNEKLYHHGILGMKWGVRRYQNYDGTLTSAGRRRLGNMSDADVRRLSSDSDRIRSHAHTQAANDYKNVGIGLQQSSNAIKSVSNIRDRTKSNKRIKEMNKIDLSQMSDAELREAVNRLNMEKSYKSLSTEHITTGRDYLSSVLAITGDVLAIGGSIATIALAIHQIRA